MSPHDDEDALPMLGNVSPAACLGGRTSRPLCHCCGCKGGYRVRRADRKPHNSKPVKRNVRHAKRFWSEK